MGRHATIAAAAVTLAMLGLGRASAVTSGPGASTTATLGTRTVAAAAASDPATPRRVAASRVVANQDAPVPAPAGPPVAANFVGPDLGALPALPPASMDHEDLPHFSDRRLTTFASPFLDEPDSTEFVASVQPVPPDVLARSTWRPGCPVTLEQLRYVTVTHVGFDGLAHRGELMVHTSVADEFVEIFRSLYEARYPIERMWVVASTTEPWLDPWWHGGDNNTASFVCRMSVGGGKWSEHASGLAVDINPYHNPYIKGDVVVPPHARSYLVRDDRPGIIHDGDVVVEAFAKIGWSWGGKWSSATDWMHFSWNDH